MQGREDSWGYFVKRSRYTLVNDWNRAQERLAALERIEDPATIEYLQRIGITTGWHCLEIGGGGGSITEWLCQRVGPTGHVMATDIDTRFLDALSFPQLEVCQHDIVTDTLVTRAFDLVHTRNVLMHLPDRTHVLAKLAEAVRPGGWVLVEEPDFVTASVESSVDDSLRRLHDEVFQKIRSSMTAQGVDWFFGARTFGILRSLGFESLKAEGRVQIIQGGSPEAELFQLSWAQLKAFVVSEGLTTERQFNEFLGLYGNPSFAWRADLRMSVWGRRPQIE